MSPEYKAAYEAHNEACKAYDVVVQAYRTMKIGDAEFDAGRKIYDEATKVFDAAFSKEST